MMADENQERRAVRLALKYNRESSMRRRLLIRLVVARFERETQETFEALVCALGWKVWQ